MKTKNLVVVVLIALLSGCSGGKKPDDAESKSPAGKDSNGANKPAGSTRQDDSEEESQKQVRKLFGDIELKAWPALTTEAIGEKLKPETVQKIIGVEHPVTAKKSDFGTTWKYSWTSPDKKQKGSVSVDLIMDKLPESQMMIQAQVRLNMVKQGQAEEVDLKKFGAVGVLRTAKRTNDLQICTKSKMVVINATNMRGRDFKDEEAKKKAAAEIAVALFDSLTQ